MKNKFFGPVYHPNLSIALRNSEYIPTKTKSYIIHRFDNVVIKDPPILQNEFQLNTKHLKCWHID